MSDALGGPAGGQRQSLSSLYLRAVALLLLAAGLVRACQILGITPDGRTFSALPAPWRTGAPTLLLVDLLAAIGLWIGAAWGPVMWTLALVVEVAMYTLFADLFGAYPLRVAAHLALFFGFIVLMVVEWRRSLSD